MKEREHRRMETCVLCLMTVMLLAGTNARAAASADTDTASSTDSDSMGRDDRDTDASVEDEPVEHEAEASGEQNGLIPPELEAYVEAPYPEAALREGLEAEVRANIDIDETGAVTAVEIVQSAGPEFDAAAREAMFAFRFRPARKDGAPIPSRVLYAYRFQLQTAPVEEEHEPEAPSTASLKGIVKDMDDAPIKGAFVTLTFVSDESGASPDVVVEPTTLETDDAGGFLFTDIISGQYTIEVFGPGFLPLSGEETLDAGEARELIYRLETESALYETVVRGRRPTREVTRREITRKEITKIPGTSGDALRAVQNMPGLARPMFTGGELVVRGSAPEDTKAYFDGLGTPMIYHFGGLTSIINSDLIDKIEFYPGNFSVRYGKSMGGVVDVETRAPATDRFHAYIDADVWDAGALAEGPLGKNWSLAVSARRSYVDGVLSLIDMGDLQMTLAPRYYDFQVLADYHLSSRGRQGPPQAARLWFGRSNGNDMG